MRLRWSNFVVQEKNTESFYVIQAFLIHWDWNIWKSQKPASPLPSEKPSESTARASIEMEIIGSKNSFNLRLRTPKWCSNPVNCFLPGTEAPIYVLCHGCFIAESLSIVLLNHRFVPAYNSRLIWGRDDTVFAPSPGRTRTFVTVRQPYRRRCKFVEDGVNTYFGEKYFSTRGLDFVS